LMALRKASCPSRERVCGSDRSHPVW